MVTASIVLDSEHAGSRIITMQLIMHRFVLSEFNTHRQISKNSESSRAIPVTKRIKSVRINPAIPLSFPMEQRGMQGGDELDEQSRQRAVYIWSEALASATSYAEQLVGLGVHKSVVNRLLEPFLWHTVIATATYEAWQGFLALRNHHLAQPEIRLLAKYVAQAIQRSTPTPIHHGHWHMPMIREEDITEAESRFGNMALDVLKKCSAARCARVSYIAHDSRDVSLDKDLALAERLINPGDSPPHASPFEHVCTPSREGETVYGNLAPWKQYRHYIEGKYA